VEIERRYLHGSYPSAGAQYGGPRRVVACARIDRSIEGRPMAIFAKYDGIDGESTDANHPDWIEALAVEWGADRATADDGGRRSRGTDIDDLVIQFEVEAAAVGILEQCLQGKAIASLDIDFTHDRDGSHATYLAYGLKNVIVSSYDFLGTADDDLERPIVTVAHSFERIEVTYTFLDDHGAPGDTVATAYNRR
jgi:type VI secretion system secreted protein Hcp